MSILGVMLAFLVFAPLSFAQVDREAVDGEVIIQLTETAKTQLVEDGTTPGVITEDAGVSALNRLAQQFSMSRMERVVPPSGKYEDRVARAGLDRWYVVQYDADVATNQVVSAYSSLAEVAHAHKNIIVEATAPTRAEKKVSFQDASDPGDDDEEERRAEREARSDFYADAIPNDPEYGTQWHYDNTADNVGTPDADINLPEAHDIETGDPSVIVNITDNKIDVDHPEFEGMYWINEEEDINNNGQFDPVPASQGGDLNGVDDDGNGYTDDVIGYNFVDNEPNPNTEVADHGSHTAGTVAAKNGNGTFGAGVAGGDGSSDSGVRLMITPFLADPPTGGGTIADAVEAITYATNNGAVISNNSWGGGGSTPQALQQAIDDFVNNAGGPGAPLDGGIFVNSAGNSDAPASGFLPAEYGPVFTVSSTEDTDTKSSFSNFGDAVDVAAPGGEFGEDGVWSAVNGGFGSISGTSMAAPHVAGVAALVASLDPNQTLDARTVEQTLIDTGKDISDNQPERMGPRVDAEAALLPFLGDDTPPAAITDLDAQLDTAETGDGFLSEPFDDESQFDVTQGETFVDGDAFFTITDGSNVPQEYSGADGTFLAGADTQSPDGTDGPVRIEWSGIDISGASSLEFSGLFGAAAGAVYDGPGSGFDPDNVIVEYRVDGGQWQNLIAFQPDGASFSNDLLEDTDFDGVGDGTQINGDGTLESFTKDIGDTGGTLDLRLTANMTLADEDFAVDEFKIQTSSGQTVATVLPENDGPGAAAELTWTAPGDDGDTGTADEYDVRFSTDGAIEDSADFANATRILGAPDPESAGTEQSLTVGGLPFDTETHFAIRTFDAVGNQSDLSNSPSVQTQEGPVASITPDTLSTEATVGETVTATATLSNDGPVDFTFDIDESALPDYLSVSPASGSVSTGESQDIEFAFDATGLSLDTFGATVEATLENGNGETALVSVATVLEVNAAPFPFAVDADPIDVTLENLPGEEGEEVTRTFTITNTTDRSREFGVFGGAATSTNVTPTSPLYNGETLRDWQRKKANMGDIQPESEAELSAGAYSGDSGSGSVSIRPKTDLSPEALGALSRLTGNATSVFGNGTGIQDSFVDLPIDNPGSMSATGPSPTAYAGNFGYGQDTFFYVITNADNAFHEIDAETGEITTLGTAEPQDPSESWTEIATDPTDGTLYASTSAGSGTNKLYTLDPETGEATFVTDLQTSGLIIATAIHGSGQMFGIDIVDNELVEINKETGAVTTVGGPVSIFPLNFAQGMDFDPKSGRLYLFGFEDAGFFGTFGSLYEIDPQTADFTFLGPHGGGSGAELGYAALPTVGFTQPSLSQGTLGAGQSIDIELTVDADRLNEKTYNSEVRVTSEVAGEPSEEIDVTLNVDGQSELAVTPAGDDAALEFDTTFTQDTTFADQPVTIRNTGTADLNATISTGDQFTPTQDSVSLFPGEATTFDVKFTPTETGDFSQTLTVASGDSTDTITLEGVALERPIAELSQSEFDVQMYPDQSYTRTLTMTNAGGNASDPENTSLEFAGMEENVITPQAIAPPATDEDFEGGVPPQDWQAVDEAGDGVEWQTNDDSDRANWTGSGVAAHVDSDNNRGDDYDARLISPEKTFDENTGLSFSLVFDQLGQSTFDVDISTDGGSNWETVRSITEDTGEDEPDGGELISISNDEMANFADVGDTYQVRFRYYTPENSPWDWYAQIDDVSFGESTEFFAFDPQSGTIAPGESEDLTLSFNAANLAPGTYGVDMVFDTNDPAGDDGDGTITVPVTIDVIEALSVTPEDSEGQNEVFPNEEFTLDMNVESLNDLEVFSYQMEMGFNTDRMQVQEVTTDGTLSEGLTLTSNIDNEDGVVTIAAADDGMNGNSSGSDDSDGEVALFDIEGEGVLVSIEATGQPDHGQMVMDLQEMVFNEGQPPATPVNDTMEVVPLYGDTDLNLSITAGDAGDALDFVVGSIDLIEAQQTHADVSGDGDVSAFDASLILQRTVGGIPCFPVESGCEAGSEALATTANSSGNANTAFAWGEVSESKQPSGDKSTMELPLVLNQAGQSVRAIDVSTKIDRDKVAVDEMTSQLPDDWRAVHHVSDDGMLKISMAGTTPIANAGKVATLTLKREESDATLEMGGNVAVNEGAVQKLETKSIVSIPDEFALKGAYPNPFRQAATLEMDLPQKANVTVEVYDLLGRKVQTAYRGEMAAGSGRTVRINGSDLSSGTYFYRARVEMDENRVTETGKMTVVR